MTIQPRAFHVENALPIAGSRLSLRRYKYNVALFNAGASVF